MLRSVTLTLRRLALLGLLAASLCSSGCIPSVGWLPDSSGIVYTGGKNFNQLLLYDLKKGKQQVLVADTGAGTLLPAISPDGNRIAVAKLIFESKQKQTKLQVILYDRRGKEIERSKALDFILPGRAGNNTEFPQLFWAPGNQGDRILVHSAGYTGIYDVKSRKLIHAREGFLLVFRGGPFRPDGAGFLVMKNPGGGWTSNFNNKPRKDLDPRFTFVGWDGKEKPLEAPPVMLDKMALKINDINKLMALFNPLLFDSGWDGDVARVSYNVDRLRYFTRKGEAVLDQAKPEMTAEGLVWNQYSFPGGRVKLRVVSLMEKGKTPKEERGRRLEILKPGKDPEEIVSGDGGVFFVPSVSPNGEMVAVHCFDLRGGDLEGRAIIIVNRNGEVVAKLQVPN